MNKGNIIFLNGVSSAGKSTLAKAIQHKLQIPYYHVSCDNFMHMAPRDILYNDFNHQMSIALNILRETALLYSNNGHGVIIDDVVLDLPNESSKEYKYAAMPKKNGSLYLYAKKLYDYPTMFVHVVCPIEELERREIVRGDRYIGQSRLNLMHEYTNIPYDLVVNTFLESTETCADRVIDLLRSPESWTALKEIRKKHDAECRFWE